MHVHISKQTQDTERVGVGGEGGPLQHINGGESFDPEPLEEGGESEQMKPCQLFAGGGTHRDLFRRSQSTDPRAAATAASAAAVRRLEKTIHSQKESTDVPFRHGGAGHHQRWFSSIKMSLGGAPQNTSTPVQLPSEGKGAMLRCSQTACGSARNTVTT